MNSIEQSRSGKKRAQVDANKGVPKVESFRVYPFRFLIKRPNCKMPLSDHQKAGFLIDSVVAMTEISCRRVYRDVNSVRSILDDWVQREYPTEKEMPSSLFFNLYYSHAAKVQDDILPHDISDCIEKLESLRTILTCNYFECEPLAEIFKKIERAILNLEKKRSTLERRRTAIDQKNP